MTPPRVLAAAGVSAGGNPGKDVGASLRGASGTPPLRVARGRAATGACPSSGPAGPPSPKGEGKGCSGGIHPSRGVGGNGRSRRGVGDAAPYGCALYSTNGGALITASTHPYTYQDYVGTAPVLSDRWYYSLTLQLRTEDQLPG